VSGLVVLSGAQLAIVRRVLAGHRTTAGERAHLDTVLTVEGRRSAYGASASEGGSRKARRLSPTFLEGVMPRPE
jgi:hypothetical protein